jgi:hypothetical protein
LVMKLTVILLIALYLTSCSNAMKKLDDNVYIFQRTPFGASLPRIDSLLIVTNGNSAAQRIADEIIPFFQDRLQKRGVQSSTMFFSYSNGRVNEDDFDNKRYTYTLWIYEQDRRGQRLEHVPHLVPLAIKLTNNQNEENIWIATSIVNSSITKKFYREKYAGMLALLFRANGLTK